MKTLLICLTPFLMMLATAGLLSSGCTADKPACTPEAVPPPPPDATTREVTTPPEFPRSLWKTRIESEKVTCWVVTGSGSGISCLSDAQRKDVTP